MSEEKASPLPTKAWRFPKLRVPDWGPDYEGILLVGGLSKGSLILVNSHMIADCEFFVGSSPELDALSPSVEPSQTETLLYRQPHLRLDQTPTFFRTFNLSGTSKAAFSLSTKLLHLE